jgi:HPt (histidine-containing phosphotransfer) domain-containing protein
MAAALKRMDGNLDLLKMLAGVFLTDYPQRMDEIRRAIRERNAWSLMRAAHTLRGAVSNFSAHEAMSAAQNLEIGANADIWDQVEANWVALQQAISRLEPELARLSLGTGDPISHRDPSG